MCILFNMKFKKCKKVVDNSIKMKYHTCEFNKNEFKKGEKMSLTINDYKFAIALANSGLTIGEAAEKAGMSRQRFYTILNSKKATAHSVGRVAKALGVDVTEIIDLEEI